MSSPRMASCGARCRAPSRQASGTACRESAWPARSHCQLLGLVIQRRVSSRGGIQVARQRIQAGFSHAGQTVTIEPGDTTLRIIDSNGELISAVPRDSRGEISRFKAYGHKQPR